VSFFCHECGAVLGGAATKHTLLGPNGCLDHLKTKVVALEYQLNLACVDIACLTDEPDPRAGSSDEVHEDLHRRWYYQREETS
jgi:hypothetical protein